MTLASLLSGPTTHIEHDETGDGSFKDLSGSLPLSMLTYFSSAIRDERRRSVPPPPPSGAPQAHQVWSEGHSQNHSYYMASSNAPSRVRLIGGDPTAHLDMIHWMTSCCHQNTIIPLSTIIASPTRFILAMASIRILGITILARELPQLLQRLENGMLDIDTAGRVFASGDNVLPEVRRSICTCIAGYFFAGRLQEVYRWMHLGKMNRRFDEGVGIVLNETRDTAKLEIWRSKDAQRYASSIGEESQGRQQARNPDEQHIRMPGGFQYSNVRVDQPQTRPPPLPPAPPPAAVPGYGLWHQHQQPPHRALKHTLPPPIPSYLTWDELRPVPDRWTPSPSSSFSRSPSPRTRRVHFSDTPRAPRLSTPPLAAWTSSDVRQLAPTNSCYQPYVDPRYQQPPYPVYGTTRPYQGGPQPLYISSRPGGYLHESGRNGAYYQR